MQVVSTGLPYLIVPVLAEHLATANITSRGFEALLAESGAKFVYVLDPTAPEGRTWDNAGRVEDVATGSAAGPSCRLPDRARGPAERFAAADRPGPLHRTAQHHRSQPRSRDAVTTGWEDL